jgi:IPT/TIG domain
MSTHQTITGAEIGLLSYLFEAVGDLLTPEQRQELTDQLTSLRPAGVAPGDLITAELFNAMLNNINDLLARVAVLEGAGGGPVISGTLPASGPVEVNSLFTIMGSGFDNTPGNNTVILDGQQIKNFRDGSSSVGLVFTIPDSFTGLPKSVQLAVETGGRRSNAVSVMLVPVPREQSGDFIITQMTTPAGTMNAGGTFNVTWEIQALTSLSDTLTPELVATGVTGATAQQWSAGATFSPPGAVPINPGQTVTITGTFVAPAGATAADISFRVRGIDDQIVKSSQALQWRAGQSMVGSSANATITFELPDAGTTAAAAHQAIDINGQSGVRLRRNTPLPIAFEVQDTRQASGASGNFVYAVVPESNSGQWQVQFEPGNETENNVAAGDDRTVAVTLIHSGGTVDQVTVLRFEARQTRTVAGANGVTPFTSFIRIPVRLSN